MRDFFVPKDLLLYSDSMGMNSDFSVRGFSGGQAEAMATLTVSSVAAVSSYYDEVIADAPALYWTLDESLGTTVADSSGNGRDGVCAASVVRGIDPLVGAGGYAAQISVDRAIVGPQVVASSSISVEIFAKIDGVPSVNIDLIGGTRPGYYPQWLLLISASTGYLRLLLSYYNGLAERIDMTVPVNVCDNLRHQIGFCWDRNYWDRNGDMIVRIILDGQVVASSAPWDFNIYAGTTSHFLTLSSSKSIIVDEVSVYLHDITPSRFAEHYARS